jgi:aldehyde:ferredoxin oxidoreductase
MFGWMGKILFINLTTDEMKEENLDLPILKDNIGGRGLGIYYLNKFMDPKCDPLSPHNMLVMATGPLTGTGAPTGARYMVMTKSPLTGAITCSNSGGMFPTEFKRAGFDAIAITGQANTPIYLWINQGTVEIRKADHLWGKDTHETTDALLSETDSKARVTCIGPAGEKRVLFASIMNDKHRAAGRSGVGAVMGRKNLKAVVVKGKGRIPLAEGSYRLADRFGHPELAPVSKKQEFPGYEPRGAQAMGLAYATSPIGGSHMRGDPA